MDIEPPGGVMYLLKGGASPFVGKADIGEAGAVSVSSEMKPVSRRLSEDLFLPRKSLGLGER